MVIELAFCEPTSIVLFIVGIALSVAASFLLKPKSGANVEIDNQRTSLASRGVYVPLLFGRQRLPPIFCCTGKRKADGEGQKGYTYSESAMHVLCVGPVWRLKRITENGKPIYKTLVSSNPDDAEYVASGTQLTTINGDTFYIYWGEKNQPINHRLGSSDLMGVESRWPNICYVEWKKKTLGSSPQWGALEYDLEATVGSKLAGSDAYMPEKSAGQGDSGINPAHLLWRVLTARYPHGLAIPGSALDGSSFSTAGMIFKGEKTPANIVLADGKSASDLVKILMSDFGFLLPQINGKIAIYLIRKDAAGSLPILDDTFVCPPDVELTRRVGPALIDRVRFLFANNKGAFRTKDMVADDDGTRNYQLRSNPIQVNLQSVTNTLVAERMRTRKLLEITSSPSPYRIMMCFGSRNLFSGQAVILFSAGQMRVIDVQKKTNTDLVEVSAVLDQYSLDKDSYAPTELPDEDGSTYIPVAADTVVRALEAPTAISSTRALLIFRVRDNGQIIKAKVVISADNAAYTNPIGSQDSWAAGGTLNDSIGSADAGPLDVEITAHNDDIVEYLEPPGGAAAYTDGTVLVLIDDEIFFLENADATGSNTYQLNGLIRAQLGTSAADHAVDAEVFVIFLDRLEIFKNPMMHSGSLLYVKTIPANEIEAVSPADVTAVSLTFA